MRSLPRRDLGSISRDLGALWGSVRRSVKVEFGEGGKRGIGRFGVISFVHWDLGSLGGWEIAQIARSFVRAHRDRISDSVHLARSVVIEGSR